MPLTLSRVIASRAHYPSSYCLIFYQVGTKATKYKMQQKAQLDSAAAKSSCRGPSQVLACSIVGVILQLVHVFHCGEEQSISKLFFSMLHLSYMSENIQLIVTCSTCIVL